MKKVLLYAFAAIIGITAFTTNGYAQKLTKKQQKALAEQQAQRAADSIAAVKDSIAKLEASLVDGVQMTFKHTDHNFGNQESGSDISYDFEFINTGKADLIIQNVSTSCGCTTPQWTRQPVKSKEKGVITVKYDSSRIGQFSKTITVYSNAKNSPVVLQIRGNVNRKQE